MNTAPTTNSTYEQWRSLLPAQQWDTPTKLDSQYSVYNIKQATFKKVKYVRLANNKGESNE